MLAWTVLSIVEFDIVYKDVPSRRQANDLTTTQSRMQSQTNSGTTSWN